MNHKKRNHSEPFSSATEALADELFSNSTELLREMDVGEAAVQIRLTSDSLWIVVLRGQNGGFALRTAYSPAGSLRTVGIEGGDRDIQFTANCSVGQYFVRLQTPNSEKASMRCVVDFEPNEDLDLSDWPRDLYMIDSCGDPRTVVGEVKAAQRGLNMGVVYAAMREPAFGCVLYYQNFTSLNEYFRAANTIPDGCVGGVWPELGLARNRSKASAILAGQRLTISDAAVCWAECHPATPQESARMFLDLFSEVYRHIKTQETEYHDWPALAKQTLDDLGESPKATLTDYGHKYLHPYVAAEYPDSMVQLTVAMALHEYASHLPAAGRLAGTLLAGVPLFFDSKLGTIRRYLPNVGSDKDKNAVDSWYLYHPMANLGRLAKEGNKEAEEMFLCSAAFGIKVARHFRYRWPVQFKINSLEVITADRKPGDPGQSDTGGLYAYVMLQAYLLTNDGEFIDEAKKAIEALSDMQFELEYQANITGWAANACLHLANLTNNDTYLNQSYVFLAGLLHNSVVWESDIEHARRYRNFLAPTCLHDAPYMAIYECYELFAAFHEYLTWGKTKLPTSVRLLLSEYIKYAPTRAWYYYPMNLPKNALAQKVRNGHIDRSLAFPLEDLYADGQPAGQVGQEIYGCGAAFTIVTRCYHPLEKLPFVIYCEYPIFDLQQPSESSVTFRIRSVDGFSCRARFIARRNAHLPQIKIKTDDGRSIRRHRTSDGQWEFRVPADRAVQITW